MSTLLAAQNVSKSFSGVPVLIDVSVDLLGGQVHTIMGENGAGKSTLMKILGGVHRPDAGTILLDGNLVTPGSPLAAQRLGIALIHQEPLSFPDLSVAENIYLGRAGGTPRGKLGQIDWATMRSRAGQLLDSLGVQLDPRAAMRGLSIADQQMVELAAALSQKARVLLMDEPTAALTPREVARLFGIVRRLRDAGTAVVFISHRLGEVFEISDRITVLRDGRMVGSRAVTETTPDEIIRLMVGRPLEALYEKPATTPGEALLQVDGLSRNGRFRDVSFDVRAGEIVGLAGLVGAGRTDVARAIFGVAPAQAGTIKINGGAVTIRSPRQARDLGVAYVPEDRQQHGLLLPMTIAANTSMADLGKVSRFGWLSKSRENQLAREWKDRLKTRLREVSQPARELSGGNQQKVVLGKWLGTEPRVLILDEPTRGIDVGAKAEVHHLMAELARQGKSILMISSDLPEVLAMSDRVLVMREGRITGRFNRGEATQESVMTAAVGTGRHETKEQSEISNLRSKMRVLSIFREASILFFVLLAFAIASAIEPRFRTADTMGKIALYTPLILIVAVGQLMVIVTRNIDLSVGSILGLSAIVAGGMFVSHENFPLSLATLIAIGVGILAGMFNGLLVAWLNVPSIITTLGTLTAYRGLIYIWSRGRQVDPNYLPDSLIRLSQVGPLSVPWIIWIALAVAGVAALLLKYTVTGRQIYAIGSNPAAAALRGIPVRRVLVLVFAITGAACGLAGILFGSRFGTINPNSVGNQMELVTISAVVIGGAAVAGGSGTILGTILGCLLLGVVNVGLIMMKVSEFWQLAFYGGAIIVAATMDALLRRHAWGRA